MGSDVFRQDSFLLVSVNEQVVFGPRGFGGYAVEQLYVIGYNQ